MKQETGSDAEAVYRPIIILGPERSGTTLLYSLLANHQDLYWFSRLDSLVPSLPTPVTIIRRLASAVTSRGYLAVQGSVSRSSGFLPPSECVQYWRRFFKWGTEENYSLDDDRFDEDDLTEELRLMILKDLSRRLRLSGKKTLLFKRPGFALKIRFLNALFPQAIFLHSLRSPADNIRSIVAVKHRTDERFWGTKIPGWRSHLNTEPVLQSALQVQSILEILKLDSDTLDDKDSRFLSVRYEDILDQPLETIRGVLEFCGLEPSDTVESAAASVEKRDGAAALEGCDPAVDAIVAQVSHDWGYSI